MKTELLYEAVKKWGRDIQLILAIEEMSELTKELSKWFREDTSSQKVAE